MPPALFSRLQLAAALIEYDNDQDDMSKPLKSAQESAIFLPFRNSNQPIHPERKSADYLGVSLPSEAGDIPPSGRESVAFDRKSRASMDALRNPFGRDSTYDGGLEDDDDEEELEVDLASWGLDAIMPKEKEKGKRKRNKSDVLPNPHDALAKESRPVHTRTMSANMLNGLGEGGAFLDSSPSYGPPSASHPLSPRRHSIGDPLDAPIAYSSEPILSPRSRSPSAHALIERMATTPPLHAVPFPSSETVRSPSPHMDGRRRTFSLDSRAMLNDPQPEEDNPFALRPPSPSRMSRFDPKAQRARTTSQGTIATQMMMLEEPVPAGRPSMGERRYSRVDLMRPKVLIMPSPLQSSTDAPTTKVALRNAEGFELSTDGRPLPPGARAARRSSTTLSMLEPGPSGPIASNSFIPNPRSSLTLSQLTFRNTLLVDGQRDVAYVDIDNRLKRATEDGQQIEPDPEPEPEPQPEIPIVEVEKPNVPKRPAGKLFGKSLIDDLEARKAEMRGKQRVFRGDDRPSMMARSQVARSSTLIDADELKRPQSQHMNSFHSQSSLARRNSANAKPLLDFEDEIPGAPRQSQLLGGSPSGPSNSRSVFGVDTLWERELAKLKVIEEQERQAEEERRKREFEEEAKKRGKKKKGKGKEREDLSQPVSPALQTPSPGIPDAAAPPVLPAIPRATARRAPPPPGDDDDDDDSDDSDASGAPAPRAQAQASGWHSDEDEGPRRTTGTGPRYPTAMPSSGGPPRLPQIPGAGDDSSEEDVPLVATIGRAAQRHARSHAGDDSSDEEKPLAALLDKTKQKLPSVGGGSLSPRSPAHDADEDDTPLGLRVPSAHFGSSLAGGAGDEDDKPLGLHPDHLRKSQFYMAQAQAQQQQQMSMMAQAQMAQMAAAQQSMIFGAPSMMSSGFFGPPMAPPMMMYPQLPPTPPPMQDAAKFGRVDKWRHDVAVEGERS